jgi:hypothetical protein
MRDRQVFVAESGDRARWVLGLEVLIGLVAVAMSVFIVLAIFGYG